MKKSLVIFISIFMILTLVACGKTSSNESSSNENSTKTTEESTNETTNNNTETKNTNTAVVYFSATGTTKEIAEKISKISNADIFEIMPKEPYSTDDLNYNNDDCRANKEMNDGSSRPAIKNDLSAITKYDTIYIGYPIWWGSNPRIIETFMDSYDLSGKKVYTFCTSGSSDIEQSINNLKKLHPNVNIISGKRFSSNASEDNIKEWIDSLK